MFCARPAPGTDDNVDEETLPAPSQPVVVCIARRYRRSAAGPHHSLPSTFGTGRPCPGKLACLAELCRAPRSSIALARCKPRGHSS